MPQRPTMMRQSLGATTEVHLHLVLIDHEPLRRTAAADCTEAMAELEAVRAGWHRFEREDKPAFARWRAREFGPLLSRAREVEIRIRDSQAIVHEVEMEMRRGFQDAHTAYQRVLKRRQNPSAPIPDDEPVERPRSNGAARKMTEFEQEALFQEWVQKSLGTNPDKMDDAAYTTTFEAFKSHMFQAPREEPLPRQQARPQPRGNAAPEPEEEEVFTPVDARVKELYRILVRRLHPDLRADGSAVVSALWHEVQEAYAASDVARMELLLALSDIELNHLGEGTSVAQMRSVLMDLERACDALEKSLMEAEREDAWNFARSGPNESLKVRVERELKAELASRTMRLDVLTRTLAAWAEGPVSNRKVMLKRQYA